MGDRDSEAPVIDPHDRTLAAGSAVENSGGEGFDRTLAAPATEASGFDRTFVAPTTQGPRVASAARPVGAFDTPNVRFEERDELGRGGMGRVAEAFDRVLARSVAVKHILSSDPDAVQRFAREARITAQLEHPGIVPVHDTGRNPDGSPYYVMRRIDGRPLGAAVPRGNAPSDLAQRLALVPNILAACDAVAYAHAHGIVHRDLKPSNILLGPFGETLVIDWGLARAADEPDDGAITSHETTLTMVGAISGTPGFMAPEQARGEPFDARGDVFALGATLFYMLTGRPPYAGDTAAAMIERAATVQAPDWARLPAGVPDDLRAILVRALAGDRAARYADAGALAADLRQFVTGNLVGAHRYTGLERLRRFVRRHRTAVAIAAISLALIGAISVIAFRRVVDERDEATRARQLETERANELVIAQARLLLDTNPTLSVALVKPLALGARWRDARTVVAAASARGVPWRLPSSAVTLRAGLSPDGLHGYSVGNDGVIRIYDLRARTARTVLSLGRSVDKRQAPLVELLGGSRFALFDGSTLAIIDERTGARTSIPIAAPAASTGFSGKLLYWIDSNRRAWALHEREWGRDNAQPGRVPVGDRVLEVRPSPDGTKLAVRGQRATWLVTRGATSEVIDAPVSALAWHPSGDGFYAVTDRARKLLAVRMGPWSLMPGVFPVTVKDMDVNPPPADSAAVSNGAVILQGMRGISIARVHTQKLATVPDRGIQLAVARDRSLRDLPLVIARDEIVVGATKNGDIDVLDDGRHHRVRAPLSELDWIASSPTSSYLLAGGGSQVLLWDLDAIVPRRGPETDSREITVGPHHELLAKFGKTSWLDLHALTVRPGPRISAIMHKLVASETRVLVHDTDAGTVQALRRDTTESVPIASGIKRAALLDDRRAVVVTANRRVELRDLVTGATTLLFDAPGDPHMLYASGDHVVVICRRPRHDDGIAIRHQISTRSSATVTVPLEQDVIPRPTLSEVSALDATGGLWFVDGAALRSWSAAGSVVTHTTLPGTIVLLVPIDGARYAVSTEAASYLVDAAAPGAARPTIPLSGARGVFESSISASSNGLLAVPGPHGGAQIVDAITGAAWLLGQSGTLRTTARLSRDGTVLYEPRRGGFVYWRIDLPSSPAATAVRAAMVTNAELAPDGSVRWPS